MDIPVTLYTRAACPLCDELEAALVGEPVVVEKVDVDTSRDLQDRYGMRVPVLEFRGEVLAEGRVEPGPLSAALRRLRAEGGA